MAEDESFENFLYATKNLVESKYILIDRNISVLLHSAVDCEVIYGLIAKCMINFDFIEEWKNATEGNHLNFPEDMSKRIAFIFCMLNNIDDRKLDITKVLEHYFSYNPNYKPYELFCKTVIVDFKNLILKALNLPTDETVEEQNLIEEAQNIENTNDAEIKKQTDEMLSLVYKLKDEVRALKKIRKCPLSKTDVIAIISTLEFAIKSNDLEYFYALVLSIKVITNYVKNLKYIVLKIEEISNNLIRS